MVAACLEHRLRRIRGEIPGIISGPGFLCIDEPDDKMMTAAVRGSCQEKDVRTISKKKWEDQTADRSIDRPEDVISEREVIIWKYYIVSMF